jgi:hypothetical protein
MITRMRVASIAPSAPSKDNISDLRETPMLKFLPLFPIALAAALAQDTPIRIISDAPGWFLGQRQTVRGDRLASSAEITGRNANDLILDCGAAGWLAYTCKKAPCRVQACARTADGVSIQRVDPDARNGAGAPASLGSMLASFLRREPKSPETLGVRAGGNPNDAVLARNGEEVDFAPALTRVLEGRSCFRLSRLPAGAVGAGATFILDWDREKKDSGRARVAGIQPGAYTLQKGTPAAQDRCVFDDPAAPGWVVIVRQSEWARIDAQWKSYTPWFRQLETSGSTPDVVATVRRAVLSSLADSVEAR